MVLEAIKCPHSGEVEPVKRHGRTAKGTQRYRCYACKKSFLTDYSYRGHKPDVKAQISQMAMNGSGVRDTARVLKVSQNTVISHFKKK
jgi:transposase-like protein